MTIEIRRTATRCRWSATLLRPRSGTRRLREEAADNEARVDGKPTCCAKGFGARAATSRARIRLPGRHGAGRVSGLFFGPTLDLGMGGAGAVSRGFYSSPSGGAGGTAAAAPYSPIWARTVRSGGRGAGDAQSQMSDRKTRARGAFYHGGSASHMEESGAVFGSMGRGAAASGDERLSSRPSAARAERTGSVSAMHRGCWPLAAWAKIERRPPMPANARTSRSASRPGSHVAAETDRKVNVAVILAAPSG